MNNQVERRLSENEALFHRVNDAIQRGRWPGESKGPVAFRCECARLGCTALLATTVAEYERVRANPKWFLMVPGHELEDLETVVEHHGNYLVVEKQGAAAAEAEETDPRS